MVNPCIATIIFMVVDRQTQKELYSETALLAFQNKCHNIYSDKVYREDNHSSMHYTWRKVIVHALTHSVSSTHDRQLHGINPISRQLTGIKDWYVDSVIVNVKEYGKEVDIKAELDKLLQGGKKPPFCSLLNSYIHNG